MLWRKALSAGLPESFPPEFLVSPVSSREEPVIRARLARRRREAHWWCVDRRQRRQPGCGERLPAALEAAYDEAILAVCLEVRQQLRDRLPDDASPVDRDAMLGAQDQPRVLEAEQLVG
jgi:hypothetical protein